MKSNNSFHLLFLIIVLVLFAMPAVAGVNAGGGSGSASVPLSPLTHLMGYGLLALVVFWKRIRS